MPGAENPLMVFVSSVMDPAVEDLSDERDAAVTAIDSLPITRSWAFEYTPASADAADDTYLDKVDECDIFLLVLGAEMTDPVAKEYGRARDLNKPRLLFVKNVRRSARAEDWLRARRLEVKYDRFEGAEDLGDRAKDAVVDEVIKSQRRYRLRNEDFDQLATKLRSEPVTFMVRTIDASELRDVAIAFPQLLELYPEFETWIERKAREIVAGTTSAYVTTYERDKAGFALVSDKGPGVRKLSTLYVKPRYQGLGVGPRLLFGVIDKAARDGVGKLYVTVSEERRDELDGLLEQFGFFVEGVSGRRYRDGSWEWIWSKRLIHGMLRRRQLGRFVLRYLFEERGYTIEPITRHLFKATQRYDGLGTHKFLGQSLLVAIAASDEHKVYQAAKLAATDLRLPLAFVSLEAIVDDDELSAGLVRLDSFDLETIFFPLFVERDAGGLIIPIKEAFVQRLIPRPDQNQFIAPSRVQLRTDNVYYRYPTVHAGLKRGSSLFFYETRRASGQSQLIGEAKLLEYAVDDPRELLSRFGRLGVYTLTDIQEATMRSGHQKDKALALRFDWFREIDNPLSRKQIQTILPSFDPMTARRIAFSDAMELRRLAGWNVEPLSFR
jgi:GNAT superfamily N-acetyltransferase